VCADRSIERTSTRSISHSPPCVAGQRAILMRVHAHASLNALK